MRGRSFMKFMRPESWSAGCAGCGQRATMQRGIDGPRAPHRAARATSRRLLMQWQTPTATDFRFGFEITLYVAAR